jgi:phospholipid/cholesterol/gamma-HCH transport system substrate-binding protein
MTRRRAASSIVASPVLVGAVTVLVIIVAVYLSYNANQGLPFVPTYDLKAELPSGSNLVPGNEARVGGFRVGLVKELRPKMVPGPNGSSRAVALATLKLDKTVEPLPRDTRVFVRQRSALGLKYVEVTPGSSSKDFQAGDTIPLKNSKQPVEFDDVFETFDSDTRENSRVALSGFGDAFAGRGQSLNVTISALRPFFDYLEPVMRNLSDPETNLKDFFKEIGETSRQVAPVAHVQAELFTNMADTFEAISRSPAALQQTIEENPRTLLAGIQTFPIQRVFLADFADLSHRLRPFARELRRALPPLNDALRVGTPVLVRSVQLNNKTANVFKALDDLADDPNTLLGLKDLSNFTRVGAPVLQFGVPYQTVCNYLTSFLNPLGEHISQEVDTGTLERVLLRSTSDGTPFTEQDDTPNDSANDRPADVLPTDDNAPGHTGDPRYVMTPPPKEQPIISWHGQPYGPAVDAQGNADCQAGQTGYLPGPLSTGRDPRQPGYGSGTIAGRYPFGTEGGSHVVLAKNTPGLAGPLDTTRRLGIFGLQDVK